MRIHSSSLNFTPIGLNQKLGRNDNAQNNKEAIEQDVQNQKTNKPSSPEEIKQALGALSATNDSSSQDNLIKPTNSRVLKALSAYNQEFNAPQQEQRAQLITGIDAYA